MGLGSFSGSRPEALEREGQVGLKSREEEGVRGGHSCGPGGPIFPSAPDTVGRGRDLSPARDADLFSGSAQAVGKKKTPDQRVLQVLGALPGQRSHFPRGPPPTKPLDRRLSRTKVVQESTLLSCVQESSVSPARWDLPRARAVPFLPSHPGLPGRGPVSPSYGSPGTSTRFFRQV